MNVSIIPESFTSREVKDFITFINSSEYKDSEDKMKVLINSPHYKTYTILNKQKVCGKLSEKGCFINWTQNRFDPPSTMNRLLEFLKGREAAKKKAEQEAEYLPLDEGEPRPAFDPHNDYNINAEIKELKDTVKKLQEQMAYLMEIAKEAKEAVDDYCYEEETEI